MVGMAVQILSKLNRLVPPRVGAINPLVKPLRNSPAKLEMMRDAAQSSASRFAAEGGGK